MATSFFTSRYSSYLCFFSPFVIIGGLTVTVGLGVVSQAQQLINSITFFLNSLVPLTERLEEFLLHNRDIQVNE